MKHATTLKLKDLVETYDRVMKVMEHDAAKAIKEDSRAYGGIIRAAKGKMQEYITEELIHIAWDTELAKEAERLTVNSKKIRIPIQMEYVRKIKERTVRDYILGNIKNYYYGLSVDKHVFIDNKMLLGVECKAYTENAMIKRILVDFHLLKTKFPHLLCYLFQLESQLGGDYSFAVRQPKGSTPTHTLMSYFSDVGLRVVTLLAGERKVDRPINKAQYFKPLTVNRLEVAVEVLIDGFRECGVA
ncbi:MAG TPA: restriction endonuclease [bacterium]|nr:restriction endonuclease [bacterium]